MKPILSYEKAVKELAQVNSCATGTDRFIAQTIPLLIKQNNTVIELLIEIKQRSKRPKRKLSAYQKHCKRILSEGYTMKAAAESWNVYKRNQNAS